LKEAMHKKLLRKQINNQKPANSQTETG